MLREMFALGLRNICWNNEYKLENMIDVNMNINDVLKLT